jgi:hypothetical protein
MRIEISMSIMISNIILIDLLAMLNHLRILLRIIVQNQLSILLILLQCGLLFTVFLGHFLEIELHC